MKRGNFLKRLFKSGCVDYTQPYKEGPSDSGFSKWGVPSNTYNTDNLVKSHKPKQSCFTEEKEEFEKEVRERESKNNKWSDIRSASCDSFSNTANYFSIICKTNF